MPDFRALLLLLGLVSALREGARALLAAREVVGGEPAETALPAGRPS